MDQSDFLAITIIIISHSVLVLLDIVAKDTESAVDTHVKSGSS